MVDIIKNLDITQFTQVYSGRQGCACGCGGTYNETSQSFKSARTKLLNKLVSDEPIQIMEGCKEYIVSWEGKNRAIRIYTKENLEQFVNC